MLEFYGINFWHKLGTLTPVFLKLPFRAPWRSIHCKDDGGANIVYCLLCGSCFPLDSCIRITSGLVPLPLPRPPGDAGELTVFFLQESCYDWWSREGSNLYRTCWPPGYSRVPFLSGVYSIKLIWSPAWHCSAGNCVVFKTWRCVGESNSHLRIDNPR